jgi:hypothetical protein
LFEPRPSLIFSISSAVLAVPSRQGAHFPQDSCSKKPAILVATSTMSRLSSITKVAPEPRVAPIADMESKATGVSNKASGMKAPEVPPICTALNFLSPGMPPPNWKTISLIVVLVGTSKKVLLLISPVRVKTLVPG